MYEPNVPRRAISDDLVKLTRRIARAAPEKWTFDWFYSRRKPHKGDVYRPGQALPEPGYETATGRELYTAQQIRAAYAQGAKDSRTLLTRCRNMLSHPAHWGADEDVIRARHGQAGKLKQAVSGDQNRPPPQKKCLAALLPL